MVGVLGPQLPFILPTHFIRKNTKSSSFDLMGFVRHWLITIYLPPTQNLAAKYGHPLRRTKTIK